MGSEEKYEHKAAQIVKAAQVAQAMQEMQAVQVFESVQAVQAMPAASWFYTRRLGNQPNC
ncbi:hypothetical protein [Paenibacillus herberti]|uniref:Uncharacterized protein n=1 Tax=Paenibacillus herberti TaxID=1619309 RepID=A0A229NY00_9BACL|nr:hypothetical protein [Paenibacillus herberti]OXM14772.1 hypothetical protein CGZ75_18025 [Paenibacillus herberti]